MESLKHRGVALLRWSEKYTKTDMVYLFKNSFWVFFGQLITSFTAFVVMIVLVNVLDKAEYGLYRFVISFILVLSVFTLPGLNVALTQSTAQGHDGQLGHVIHSKIKWGLLGSMVSLIIAAYYWWNQNIPLTTSFIMVAIFIPFYGTFFSYYNYLQGKQLFNQAALTQAVSRIVFLIVMVGVALLAPNAVWLITAYLLSTVLMQYVGHWWTRKNHGGKEKIDDDLIDYGKYLTLFNNAPVMVAAQVGIIATWYFLGDVEAAIYAVAVMLPMEANRFGAILNQISIPKIARQNIDIPALFQKIFKLELLLFVCWLAYAALAPFMFAILFPEYPEAVTYSIIAMLMLLLVPRIILRGFLLAKKNKKEIRIISLGAATLQIFLTLTLIPFYGILGAILATVLAWSVEYISLGYLVSKQKDSV